MANMLSAAKRTAVVSALVEGNSIRAAGRMVGVSKDTVLKLMVDLGGACARYQDETLRDLSCKRIQADEIWSFCYSKQKNVPERHVGEFGYGDVWTFTALDADTNLCISFLVGSRDAGVATEFMQDVASRVRGHVQLTTDGHSMYLSAVEDSFAGRADFAQLHKVYADASEGQKRYSPAVCTGANVKIVSGRPDPEHVSTSYVERSNLTMRMSIRRFTPLANAFTKKVQNYVSAVSIYAAHYNFCRMHTTLRCTPAMAAGVARSPWSIEQLVALLPAPNHAGGRPKKTT
jgi:hypothetical protein